MIEQLLNRWYASFGEEFPDVIVRAPGRVNIIGEHTDYNHGWVMPGAMDLSLYILLSRSAATDDESTHKWIAADLDETIVFAMDGELPDTRTIWPKYIHGAIQYFAKETGPLNILIGGNLPIGAGVSSSSALVGGILVALQKLTGDQRNRQEIAELCNQVEREVIGLRGGIMFLPRLRKPLATRDIESAGRHRAHACRPPEAQVGRP